MNELISKLVGLFKVTKILQKSTKVLQIVQKVADGPFGLHHCTLLIWWTLITRDIYSILTQTYLHFITLQFLKVSQNLGSKAMQMTDKGLCYW